VKDICGMKSPRVAHVASHRSIHLAPWMLAAVLAFAAGVSATGQESRPSTAPAGGAARTRPKTHPERVSAAIVPVEDMITDITNQSIRQRVAKVRQGGANCIVFEINTFGGLVTSALEICEYIKNLGDDVYTVAWVHPKAISAGAMISLACNEIIMASSSKIGDSAPIAMAPTGGAEPMEETERAKVESPIVQEFRDSARRNAYSEVLAEAMVRFREDIYWLENTETGERRFAHTEEKKGLLGETKSLLADWARLGKKSPWKLIESYVDPVTGRNVTVKQPVLREKELLTMSQSEAVMYGFARTVVSSESELASYLSARSPIPRLDTTWSERLARYLTSPSVRVFLFLMMMIAAYAEFHAPGHGVGGIVALLALAVFLGAPYLTGLANIWEIVVVGIGIALLMLEIFVIPGFGIAGITGIACIFVGLLASFIPEEPNSFPIFHWPELEGTFEGLYVGIRSLAIGLVLSLAGMVVISRYLPKTPVMAGFAPPNPTHDEVVMPDPYDGLAAVGDIGTAEAPLRPAGKARFGATLVDVVSQGEFIPAGGRIVVIERHGNRVVVRLANA
jgi:membrane-bound serine protease (ClpP class)